jgi:streptogramin lyase
LSEFSDLPSLQRQAKTVKDKNLRVWLYSKDRVELVRFDNKRESVTLGRARVQEPVQVIILSQPSTLTFARFSIAVFFPAAFQLHVLSPRQSAHTPKLLLSR